MEMKVMKKENQGLKNITMYWLIVKNNKGQEIILNVGEKTYKGVEEMIAEESEPVELDKQTEFPKPGKNK